MFLGRHQILSGTVEVKGLTGMQTAALQITAEVVTLLIIT